MYYPTKQVLLRGANVDDAEQLELLEKYKDWLKSHYQEQKEKRVKKKEGMKKILLDGLTIVTTGDSNDYKSCSVNDAIIYHMTG